MQLWVGENVVLAPIGFVKTQVVEYDRETRATPKWGAFVFLF